MAAVARDFGAGPPQVVASTDRTALPLGAVLRPPGPRDVLAIRQLDQSGLVAAFVVPHDNVTAGVQAAFRSLLLTYLAVVIVASALLAVLYARSGRTDARRRLAEAERERRAMAELVDTLPGVAYRGRVSQGGAFTLDHLSASARQLLGAPHRAAVALRPGENERAFFQAVRSEGRAVRESQAEALDGSKRWLRNDCRRVRSPDAPEQEVEVVGVLTDISRERALREEADLARQMASLGALASSIAHEVNQPAAVIALAADVALLEAGRGSGADIGRIEPRLEEIARQASRMRSIVDFLRQLARPSEGSPEAVDIREAAEGAVLLVGHGLAEAGVEVTLVIPETLPPVACRLVALEQVFVSLLQNSRDAILSTPREGNDGKAGAVTVSAQAAGEAGFIRILVTDTGPGFEASALERAFEPLFSTKPGERGNGLGLSLCRQTVLRFRGRIAARNRPSSEGSGACVELELPVAVAETDDAERGA